MEVPAALNLWLDRCHIVLISHVAEKRILKYCSALDGSP
jgi:hypothetical protein